MRYAGELLQRTAVQQRLSFFPRGAIHMFYYVNSVLAKIIDRQLPGVRSVSGSITHISEKQGVHMSQTKWSDLWYNGLCRIRRTHWSNTSQTQFHGQSNKHFSALFSPSSPGFYL